MRQRMPPPCAGAGGRGPLQSRRIQRRLTWALWALCTRHSAYNKPTTHWRYNNLRTRRRGRRRQCPTGPRHVPSAKARLPAPRRGRAARMPPPRQGRRTCDASSRCSPRGWLINLAGWVPARAIELAAEPDLAAVLAPESVRTPDFLPHVVPDDRTRMQPRLRQQRSDCNDGHDSAKRASTFHDASSGKLVEGQSGLNGTARTHLLKSRIRPAERVSPPLSRRCRSPRVR